MHGVRTHNPSRRLVTAVRRAVVWLNVFLGDVFWQVTCATSAPTCRRIWSISTLMVMDWVRIPSRLT